MWKNFFYFSKSERRVILLLTVTLGLLCIFGLNFFDALDYLTAKIMLPVAGMLTAIFVGWVINRKIVHDEVTNYGTLRAPYYSLFFFVLRYVAPVGIAIIFVNELGLLKYVEKLLLLF